MPLFSSRQTFLGSAATRFLTRPNSSMRLSASDASDTVESTHNEPSESFTTVMRVVNMTSKSRTSGPLTIHKLLEKSWNSDIVASFCVQLMLEVER